MADSATNQRVRYWKRDKKGKPWLNDIEIEAGKVGLSMNEGIDRILERIVKNKMLRDFLQPRR